MYNLSRIVSDTNVVKILFSIISIGLWCINFFYVHKNKPISFRIAKGFGLNLRVWIMFLYFTMSRSILHGKIEKHVVFHKFIGYIIMISTFGHTIAHVFYSTAPDIVHLTGYVLTLLFIVIGLGYMLKDFNYSLFKSSHMIYYIVLPLCMVHIQRFWIWFGVPLIIYSIETFLNFNKIQISSIKNIDKQNNHMFLSIPRIVDSIPGCYYYLCIPKLGLLEWHPFSICSSSHIDHLIFMIEAKGDWTNNLYNLNERDLKLIVMGPFRTSSSLIMNSSIEKKIVVCTGIGITPFLSIINTKIDDYHTNNNYRNDYSIVFQKDIEQHRAYTIDNQNSVSYKNSEMEIHWTFKDLNKVINFFNYIRKIAERSVNININIYITAKMTDEEKSAFVEKYQSHSIKSITFARMDINSFQASQIYFCGSPNLRESLKLHCVEKGIEFYSEVF